MKKRFVLLLLISVMVVMVGCNKQPTLKSIAGTYKSDLMGGELIISKDGTFVETGFNGTCEIIDGKLIMKAGSLSVIYEIQKQDGYYVLASDYVNYIPVAHYDDYTSTKAKAQEAAATKQQEEKDQHQLAGQYLWRNAEHTPQFFIEFFDGWSYTRCAISQLLPDDLHDTLENKVYFSFTDAAFNEVFYYNNDDLESWQFDLASGKYVDDSGATIPKTVYWYVSNNTERTAFDFDLDAEIYLINQSPFALQDDGTLIDESGATISPAQFIYQFNI